MQSADKGRTCIPSPCTNARRQPTRLRRRCSSEQEHEDDAEECKKHNISFFLFLEIFQQIYVANRTFHEYYNNNNQQSAIDRKQTD